MGASQEKKKRRIANAEAAAKTVKTKKRMPKWAKATIIILALALVIGAIFYFTSGYFYRNTTAVRLGDTDYSIVDFNYYYNLAYQNYRSHVMETYPDNYVNYLPNEKQSFKTQYFDGERTWDEYIEGNAMSLLQELTFLYGNAEKEGYKLSQEGRSAVNESLYYANYYAGTNGFASPDAYLAANYGKGMTYDYYKETVEKYQLAQEYAENKAKSFKFNQEDCDTYYEMMRDVYDILQFRSFNFTFNTGALDENAAKDEAYYQASDFKNAVKSEEDFIKLARQYAPEEEKAKYEDDKSTLTSAMASNITTDDLVMDWLLDPERKEGDMEIIETAEDYILVYFISRSDNSYNLVKARQILVQPESVDKGEYEDNDAGYEAALDVADAAAKAQAEKYLQEWLDKGGTEEQFAEMADEYSADGIEGGLYEDIYKGMMIDTFDQWLFDGTHKVGDYTIVKSNYGYHIIYFSGYGERYRDYIAQNDLGTEAYEEWYDDNFKEYSVEKTFAYRLCK